MRRQIGVLALAATLGAIPAIGQEPPPEGQTGPEELQLTELYRSLADHNRYPAVTGLKDAQADVKSGIFDTVVAAFPDAVTQPITVKFYWSRPSEEVAPKKKFAVTGIPDGLADLKTRSDAIFGEAQDFVISDPVYWTIANSQAKAVKNGGEIVATGTAASPADPIKSLMVKIDAASYEVRRMEMDLGQAKLTIEMKNKDLGGKWAPEQTTVSYPQYRKIVRYEYTQVGEYWLPSKISIDFLGLDGKELQPTFEYEFSGWKVNEGLPAGVV